MKRQISILIIMIFTLALSESEVAAQQSGSISGKLLKSNGRPLPYTEIELVPAAYDTQIPDKRLWATTNTLGNFTFADVPSGKFTLSINFDESPTDTSPYSTAFYPNTARREEAEIFEITPGKKIAGLKFQLPPALAQLTISGKVLGSDLKPAAGAYINLHLGDNRSISFGFNQKTDKNGNFTLKGFEGEKYLVTAFTTDCEPTPYVPSVRYIAFTKSETFTLSAKTPSLILILEPIKQTQRIPEGEIGRLFLAH